MTQTTTSGHHNSAAVSTLERRVRMTTARRRPQARNQENQHPCACARKQSMDQAKHRHERSHNERKKPRESVSPSSRSFGRSHSSWYTHVCQPSRVDRDCTAGKLHTPPSTDRGETHRPERALQRTRAGRKHARHIGSLRTQGTSRHSPDRAKNEPKRQPEKRWPKVGAEGSVQRI